MNPYDETSKMTQLGQGAGAAQAINEQAARQAYQQQQRAPAEREVMRGNFAAQDAGMRQDAYNRLTSGQAMTKSMKEALGGIASRGMDAPVYGFDPAQRLKTENDAALIAQQYAENRDYAASMFTPDRLGAYESTIRSRIPGLGYAGGGEVKAPWQKRMADFILGAPKQPAAIQSQQPQLPQQPKQMPVYTSYGADPRARIDAQLRQAEGYADGGMVAPQEDPMYAAYVKAAHSAGVQAKPYGEAVAEMAQMRAAMARRMAGAVNGGATTGYAMGGEVDVGGYQVDGPGTGKSDSIPAMIDGKQPSALSKGEFIFPKKVVEYYGTKVLDAMVEKARQAMKKQAIA